MKPSTKGCVCRITMVPFRRNSSSSRSSSSSSKQCAAYGRELGILVSTTLRLDWPVVGSLSRRLSGMKRWGRRKTRGREPVELLCPLVLDGLLRVEDHQPDYVD
jgi:hypothetical protein